MFRVVNDMTAQYSSLEAWGYDRFIAPAVVEMGRASMDRHLAQIPKGCRVLDVGCGGGRHAAMIGDERPDLEIVGIDLSPGQVARAVARAKLSADTQRVRELLLRAKDCREAGHVRMARMLYTHITSAFDASVPGVTEAKNRLNALPKEDDR